MVILALTKRVDTRMSEKQYKYLKILAEEEGAGMGLATYIRFIIQQHLLKRGITSYED